MKPTSARRAAVAALTIAAAAVSSIRLRSLPVFGDEAIFLRLARLLRDDPWSHAWISIRAAAAPLHTWLLAAAWKLSGDPVVSGRALSVAAGVLAVPALAWCLTSIRRLQHPDQGEGLAGIFGAALAASSPFFVWTQRVARVDSVFAAETIVVAGASLWLAVRIAEPGPRRRIWAPAAAFGALMGVVMLTRTAVSYPFWALPAVALIFSRPFRIGSRAPAAAAISLAVGFAVFAPYLVAGGPENVMTRLFHFSVTRPRASLGGRFDLAAGNARVVIGAFAAYLGVPILLAAAVGAALLALRRRWRVLGYLAAWEAVALLPAVVFAGDYFPRYALPAAAPLLACIALALEEIRRPSSGTRPSLRGTLAAAAFAAILVAVAGSRSARFIGDWRFAPWTRLDRWQLVSGWPAGTATEQAIAFVTKFAGSGKVLVLTPEISGNPTDSVWLLLEGAPGIDLAFAFDALNAPLLAPAPGRPDSWQAREDLVRGGAPRLVPFASRRPILLVTSDPILTTSGWRDAREYFSRLNPEIAAIGRFENPGPFPGGRPTDGVAVFSARPGRGP